MVEVPVFEEYISKQPVTFAEDWYEVPNQTVFRVGQDYRLDMEPLRMPA
ncbi:hypothetical protein [Yoonia maritima]